MPAWTQASQSVDVSDARPFPSTPRRGGGMPSLGGTSAAQCWKFVGDFETFGCVIKPGGQPGNCKFANPGKILGAESDRGESVKGLATSSAERCSSRLPLLGDAERKPKGGN